MEKGKRVYNFSAGPSALPEAVLERAAGEMLCYGGSGMSVMEMSHRSAEYEAIIRRTEELLRKLMRIPENYKVLLLQGGATLQFAMAPLNLMREGGSIDLVQTGVWTQKAAAEAAKFGSVRIAASSEDTNFSRIPELRPEMFSADADYAYICYNNTIFGTRYAAPPDCGGLPLVADVSSCILSEALDVSKFALIFAGAQKNLGPAGLTVAIIREDLLGRCRAGCPTMLRYKTHADEGSMYNTPPTYAIYICMLVLEWVESLGGLAEMQRLNERKAAILYDFLDGSSMFRGTAEKSCRSLMNIPFVTEGGKSDKKFIAEAEAAGFVNLKGHRLAGGMRASIYNAMPESGVLELVEFMRAFEAANG